MPRSTRKPRMSPASSLAQTTATSAIGELVIQVLDPFSTKPPSTERARVRMAPGSEPPSGSVRPKQPTNSPVRSLGRKRSFWSSEPNAQIGNITSEDCTEKAER